MSDTSTLPRISAITLEVIDAHLTYAVREMRSTLIKMAYSPIITETHDFATAICTAEGEIIAMNDDIVMHMYDIRDAVSAALRKYGDTIAPGDRFLVNDPWECGSHLNDVSLISPYFQNGKLMLWLATTVHWGDVGGAVPGSVNGGATDVFQEGIRFPLTRVTPELLEVLLANFRQPFEIEGMYSAQSTCMKTATKRLDETCEHFGVAVIEDAVERILANEASKAASRIADLADGVYYFEDYLENAGSAHPLPVRIACAMTIDGDRLTFDFEGSSPQANGVANCTITDLHAGVFEILVPFLSPGHVSNSGAARCWSISGPKGSVVNSSFPAANGAYANVMFGAVHACVIGCLSQVLDDVPGISTGSSNNMNVAGRWPEEREGDPYWLMFEYPPGGWGATRHNDGSLLAWSFFMGDLPVMWPTERIEALNPIQIHFNELYVDSGGPGKMRGGLGVRRAFEVLLPGTFTILGTDGVLPRPGMAGGFAGALNRVEVIRGGKPVVTDALPLKTGGFPIIPGDIILYLVSGGGGWGDPLERDEDAVLADFHDGYVSIDGAREDYGVVLGDGTVDHDATAELRRTLREARQHVEVLAAEEDELDGSKRVARISAGLADRLGVGEDDLLEYVNPRGGHVRAWVRIDPSLEGDSSPIGPRLRSICSVTSGDRVHVRSPFTYVHRRQDADMVAAPPLGRLFTEISA
ncbi:MULTISPECIES: hydantoinase B/oxoprolinase family protein [unclassified Pseudofrankia]|uniref:hydantoinase B/oxoprolinase family protein n=1 Tax=unclassified Pseudofrankia TaxID=2994372 RepID=UPI0008D8EDE4|nr:MULTISPECIES: hydantoinase B/oxoprolinase family protein [unclassified Pseudofrankia]MDT3444664.1 hydantoinase B/oxoprolinase family protein [Pseudofrankia sp. BMG5.37]OHV66593.1 hypothetical protein BCD48_35935 [Pseudofrankia sp. BMG5.36]